MTLNILTKIFNIDRDAINLIDEGNVIVIRIEKDKCGLRKYIYPDCEACPIPGFVKGFLNARGERRWRVKFELSNGKPVVRREDQKYCYFTLIS